MRESETGLWARRSGRRLWSFPAYWAGVLVAFAAIELLRFTTGGDPPRTAWSLLGAVVLMGLAVGAGAWRTGGRSVTACEEWASQTGGVVGPPARQPSVDSVRSLVRRVAPVGVPA